MQEYISKQHRILRPAEQIYAVISRFDNLTPAVADRVEEWQATEETCSFKAKGFTVRLRMEERIEPRHVKIVGDDGGIPLDFAFWIQLHKVSDTDTRMRPVLHTELGLRLLDSAPQSLRHRHPHAAGAAHRTEHDDENDDRRQAPGRHRPDRRRHRSRDAGAGVGRQL